MDSFITSQLFITFWAKLHSKGFDSYISKIKEEYIKWENDKKNINSSVLLIATNKNKTYTPLMSKISEKYGLELTGDWNTELLPHQGRHPNVYHDFILEKLVEIDTKSNGDTINF